MISASRRLVRGALLVLLAVPSAPVAAEAPRYADRPVVEVLEELRDRTLDFIYSSELLPPTLRVLAEPQSTNSLLIAREILAPHGLRLSAVRPGLYAVVTGPRSPVIEAAEIPAPVVDRGKPPRPLLTEIVVSTSRYSLDHAGGFGAVQIGGDAIESQPVLGEDVIRGLARLPGIAQSGVSAQSSIRGGETGEVLTLLDGFPLRQVFHLPGYHSMFGVLDPGLIDDAEIYTGGFPLRYGNRMSGVFDLRTIDARDKPSTALGLSVFNAMARHGGELAAPGIDWLGAARVGTLRPFIHAFAQDAGEPTYSDVYARVGHGDPDRLRLTGNFLWARDELSITREDFNEQAVIESLSRYLWLRADREWSNGASASLWLGHSGVDSTRRGTIEEPEFAIGAVNDRRYSEYSELRGRYDWQPGKRHWIETGIEWVDEKASYRYAADATYPAAVAALFSRDATLTRAGSLDPQRERLALFAAHRWQVSGDLISEIGLRAQRTITAGTTAESWLYDPRFNLRWEISQTTSVRAHWGRFHQTDEVHELKVEDGLTAFPEAQRSDHFIIGADHFFGNGLALRLEWFRKLQDDPRPHFENLLDPMSLLPEISPDRVQIAPSEAEILGAELSLISEGPELRWWAAIAWSEAQDRVDGVDVARSWDQTWAASGGMDWTRGTWRFGAVGSVREGWPTTQVQGTTLGERNGKRLPTRATIDLRAERRKPLAVGSFVLTFELTNALNIGNTCCFELLSADDGSGGVTFSTKQSDWLPVVPSIGVLWEF